MSVSSGFFNSELADRLYDATDFNKLVGSILVEGVIPFGGNLLVEENTGLTVNVETGRAWFLDSWINNDAILPVTLDAADAAYTRYDIIVLDFDVRQVTRANTIMVVKGTPSASPVLPALVDTEEHKQYPLAVITVPAAATDILQSNIENKVGTEECPFASGILQQVNTDGLLMQWDAQFNAWFDNLQDELDSNQAANLQSQIDVIEERLVMSGRNILINGDMSVAQRGVGPTLMESNLFDYAAGGPDRWRPGLSDSGNWNIRQLVYPHGSVSKTWLRIDCVQTKPTLSSGSSFWVHQRIEQYRVDAAGFGDPINAKPLTVSFLFRASKPGTYVVELLRIGASSTQAVSRSFVYTTQHTIQKVVLTFPPNTSFPLDRAWNEEGLRIGFYVSAGSNMSSGPALNEAWIDSTTGVTGRSVGQVNLADTLGAYAMWTDIQLEIGAEASPFERLSYEDSLKACRRYYYGITSSADKRWVDVYVNGSPAKDFCHFDWPVHMRTVPLVYFAWTQTGVGSGWNFYCTNDTTRSQITEQHSTRQFSYRATSPNGSTGYTYQCELVYLAADAELT